ncbi:ankyrin repeat-containing domain protein [Trichophaea hybrida]|nr:ankyrin repeat-containing domain protein [Trichophaea hybrida]
MTENIDSIVELAKPEETPTTLQHPTHTGASKTSSHQTLSVVQYSAPSRDPWHKKFRISSRLFGASVFATRLPPALADAGDDFANNLFSDLAPVLALFGEKVATQYMSQSMGWVEDIIFAMAPLGIITAIVCAIRVSGPRWMKAVIGRAREGNGVVEVELMSSTSSDVCELWNGDGVVRALGSAEVIELYYLDSSLPDQQDDQDDDQAILLESSPARRSEPTIYDFESAKRDKIILQRSNPNTSSDASSETDKKAAPNIALNISGQRVSDFEFKAVAFIGTLLQMGVIVFAGLSVLWPPWNSNGKFTKGGKPVMPYAFPSMAAGTVALVIGMFLCAYIIERSTVEDTWTIQQNKMRVAWLQKGGIVNDQQFDSYLILRNDVTSKVPTNFWRGVSVWWAGLLTAIRVKLRANVKDNRQRVMTSRKKQNPQHGPLTTVAVSLSLLGFMAQFVGLRGLNWWVAIAQLLATAIMTVLRAVVRRNLVHDVKPQQIESGYELDTVARQIKGCADWNVVTWGFDRGNFNAPSAKHELGNMVMDARCRLGALSRWGCQWQKTVDSTCEAIEAVINYLCMDADVTLTNLSDEFQWELIVEVGPSADPAAVLLQAVQLSLKRVWLSEGRGWGDWKVDRVKIEAVLGLWMLHFKDLGIKNSQALPEERIHRIFDIDGLLERKTYEQWIRRQANIVSINSTETQRLIGKPSIAQPTPTKFLAVISDAPLENVCGQFILSEFISNVARKPLVSIGGKVRVRGGSRGVKASFGLRNSVLDELASKVQQTGLATIEEAFLSIVPPLANSGRLPLYGLGGTEVFSDTAKEITTYLEGGRLDQAEPLLLWLLDVADSSASGYEADGKWSDACRVYFHLCSIYDRIEGGEDYADRAEEAMGLFCERMLISTTSSINNEALQDPLKIVRNFLGSEREEEVWKGRLQRWGKLREGARDILSTSNQITTDIRDDTKDSLGRTPLILAAIQGRATKVGQLLKRQTNNPESQDCYGRTAMHYASARGYTSVTRILCSLQASKSIDIHDNEGKSPLDLAIENNYGATVALLIFNGAKDSNDQAKKLLELSIRHGSPAAVKAMLNKGEEINFRDTETGRTPLHWSVWRDSREGSRLLLKEKADLQAQDELGQTALHYAARKGRAETVKLLLGKGAIVGSQSCNNSTALHLAAQNGHDDVLRLLLEKDADVNAQGGHYGHALQAAAHAGSDATVRLLLEKGADIRTQGGHYGNALQAAAHAGSDATVRLLLEKGVDIRTQGGHYGNALQAAAHAGSDATVQLFLEKGADIRTQGGHYGNALQAAAHAGSDATVRLLLEKGAEIRTQGGHYGNALQAAAHAGSDATVRLLLEKGADIRAQGGHYGNALQAAAHAGSDATVRLLLEKGADIRAQGGHYGNALQAVAHAGSDATVRLLLEKGADIRTQGGHYGNALQAAAHAGSDATVRLLLEKGADIRTQGGHYGNALQAAAHAGSDATNLLRISICTPIMNLMID